MRLTAAVLLVLLPAWCFAARIRHNDAWARQHFASAERMREALNGRPANDRTRREYQRVINAYRSVYYGAPASSKADPSVVATAELMVEMGRQFDDSRILRGAVAQYRFLRKEYPGSKYRFDALFTIGEVYKDDLDDPDEARATFEDFLHRYPRNHLADDARSALKELDADAEQMEQAAKKAAGKSRASDKDTTADASADRRSKLPRVTGVRHWSAPDYTRVAIDIEQGVKFDSQRISQPDRIFFDLRGTKLASTLVGKTFDVDDGFLKKIRVAEFQPGRTRVVLEVDNLASYDAFLLPNPYRLIIDIHGKESRKTLLAKANRAASPESASEPDSAVDDDSDDSAVKHSQASPQKPARTSPDSSKTEVAKDEAASDYPDAPPTAATGVQAVSGLAVVKTTVPVPGSNRRIPRTIVEAEDHAPTTVAKLETDKVRPEVVEESNPRKDAKANQPQEEATFQGSRRYRRP